MGSDDAPGPAPSVAGSAWRWVVGLLIVLAVGAKLYLNTLWFVGVDQGNVAIFRGLPEELLGLRLSSVEERTDIPAADAEEFETYADLESGIGVEDEAEARMVVEQIRDDVEGRTPPPPRPPDATPTPSASARPTPTGSG